MKKRIKSIEVSNSTFFGPSLSLEFSEGLNCIMGGRGTGKSTLLHFIDSAVNADSDETSLLSNNLHNGRITLLVEADGIEFKVEKTLGVEPLVTNTANNTNLSIDELAEKMDCDIYPASRIESIGKSSRDRLALVDKRIAGDVEAIKSEIKNIQITLGQNASGLRAQNARIVQIEQMLAGYSTAEADLDQWKKAKPTELSHAENAEFETADDKDKIRNSEKRYVKNVRTRIDELQTSLNSLDDELARALKANEITKNFTNKTITDPIGAEIDKAVREVIKNNDASRNALNTALGKIEGFAATLSQVHQDQHAGFVKLRQKLEQHRDYTTKYNELSSKVQQRSNRLEELKEEQDKKNKLAAERAAQINKLNKKKQELFALRKKTVDELNTELGGHVKITLTFGGITEEYQDLLRNALRGSNMRYNVLIPNIASTFTPDRFAALIHAKDEKALRSVKEIDEARVQALIAALYEKPEIYQIESLYIEDLPEFFLKVEERDSSSNVRENFKPSDELSTGQRCTAVLPIVFAVSDNPLIIDQPEDNLDNEFINDTVRKIVQEQKKRRQLIFITHNPNIPVVSDAEFNVFLHFENKMGHVSNSGSVEDVKKDILDLLEGGRPAFDKREELYRPLN